jgi:hypothetical protein
VVLLRRNIAVFYGYSSLNVVVRNLETCKETSFQSASMDKELTDTIEELVNDENYATTKELESGSTCCA